MQPSPMVETASPPTERCGMDVMAVLLSRLVRISRLADALTQAPEQRIQQIGDDPAAADLDLGAEGHAWQQPRTGRHGREPGGIERDAAGMEGAAGAGV